MPPARRWLAMAGFAAASGALTYAMLQFTAPVEPPAPTVAAVSRAPSAEPAPLPPAPTVDASSKVWNGDILFGLPYAALDPLGVLAGADIQTTTFDPQDPNWGLPADRLDRRSPVENPALRYPWANTRLERRGGGFTPAL